MWRFRSPSGERRRRWRGALGLGLILVGFGAAAVRAERPPAVAAAERSALDVELRMLRRKNESLGASLAERRTEVRARVRTLYKLSRGGYLRLLLQAETPADFFVRRKALGRVVARDLVEVKALGDELKELERERARLREREARAAGLEAANAAAPDGEFPAHAEGLVRPVPGPIVAGFGPSHEDVRASLPPEAVAGGGSGAQRRSGGAITTFEVGRDGVVLRSVPGESVRAVAPGRVLAVSTLPDLGTAVLIDHGEGWVSVTAGMGVVLFQPGDSVIAGSPLGQAAGSALELQLMQSGTWVDPAPWLTSE